MSVPLEPREILSYLNELGYTNITAQQLKAFIKGRINFFYAPISNAYDLFHPLRSEETYQI